MCLYISYQFKNVFHLSKNTTSAVVIFDFEITVDYGGNLYIKQEGRLPQEVFAISLFGKDTPQKEESNFSRHFVHHIF